jgi:hypothetical protein
VSGGGERGRCRLVDDCFFVRSAGHMWVFNILGRPDLPADAPRVACQPRTWQVDYAELGAGPNRCSLTELSGQG